MRRDIRNSVCLGSIGLAASAAGGYLAFWSWFLSWRLVRPVGVAVEAAAFLYLVCAWQSTSKEARLWLKPLLAPALLVFTATLVVLAATFVYGGEDVVFITAGSRFSHPLPGDNGLPYTFAYSLMKYHRVPIPIQLDWLASDRPPLQTAMVLSQYFALIWPINMGYQVLCMLLQSLWLFGLWLLLSAFELSRSARSLILAGCLFSSFVFVNTAFVWPKLMAAAYFLGMLALLVGRHVGPGAKSRTTMTVTAGVLLTWSLLAHGGTVFALGGLAFLAFCYRRSVSGRSVAVFVSAVILLYLPWTLYQKLYDPPGNRLLKMHLAGVDPIDKRGVFQTLSDSYRALTMRQIADYKRRNLEEAFVYLPFWPLLRQLIFELPRKEPARSQALVAIAHNLNAAEFFSVSSTAGLLLPGLAFLGLGVWPRFRSNEWRAGVLLLGFTVFSNVFWSLVMFGPETTVVHQGAYAVILAYMAASILGWWTMSRWAALVATLLEVGLFVYTNAFLIVPSKATLHFDVLTLLFLALAGTVYLIIRLGKSEASQTVVEAIPSSDALIV